MNQEIQQNTTENKKPQMYVSWEKILLNSVIMVVLMSVIFGLTIGAEGVSLGAPYAWVFILATTAIIVGYFRNNRWYLQTKTVDIIFITWAIISTAIATFAIVVFFGNPPVWMIIVPLAVVSFCIYLNHKSQKTEIEIRQGKRLEEISDKKPLILSSKNFTIYLIVWIVGFVVYLLSLGGDPAPDFLPNPFMVLWGGMFFAGLYVVINNQENAWKRLFGYVIVAAGLIAFLALLLVQ